MNDETKYALKKVGGFYTVIFVVVIWIILPPDSGLPLRLHNEGRLLRPPTR